MSAVQVHLQKTAVSKNVMSELIMWVMLEKYQEVNRCIKVEVFLPNRVIYNFKIRLRRFLIEALLRSQLLSPQAGSKLLQKLLK
jgi:hypothetical protein